MYSEADAGAKHVREADAAEPIGEAPAPASYLNPAAIVEAALRSGAQAVHPGYGFLSESAKLAEAVSGAGLAWIGPPPDVLELAGDKVACRRAFEKSSFPVLRGAGPLASPDEAVDAVANATARFLAKNVSGPIKLGAAYVYTMRLDGLTNVSVNTSAATRVRFPALGPKSAPAGP